jgi:hypothetical protein
MKMNKNHKDRVREDYSIPILESHKRIHRFLFLTTSCFKKAKEINERWRQVRKRRNGTESRFLLSIVDKESRGKEY